jgi:hypothetical protein
VFARLGAALIGPSTRWLLQKGEPIKQKIPASIAGCGVFWVWRTGFQPVPPTASEAVSQAQAEAVGAVVVLGAVGIA